jgi:hypothetical protein
MKAKRKLVWLTLLLLTRSVYIYADEQEYQESSEYKFITLILHGWSDAIAGTGIKDGFYDPDADRFLIAKERAEYGGDQTAQYNIMHYKFSNMADYGSETFLREIGSFNPGSQESGSGHIQPFISLARCEWVYRTVNTGPATANKK